MHTQRFKALQIPSGTLSLLESFASSVMRATPGARIVRTLDELPLRQRQRIGTAHDQQYVWFAWEEGDIVRLVTGALALELSRERGRPVLEVRTYDHNGLLDESGTWVWTLDDRWDRCDW